jgi:hypothetical protein
MAQKKAKPVKTAQRPQRQQITEEVITATTPSGSRIRMAPVVERAIEQVLAVIDAQRRPASTLEEDGVRLATLAFVLGAGQRMVYELWDALSTCSIQFPDASTCRQWFLGALERELEARPDLKLTPLTDRPAAQSEKETGKDAVGSSTSKIQTGLSDRVMSLPDSQKVLVVGSSGRIIFDALKGTLKVSHLPDAPKGEQLARLSCLVHMLNAALQVVYGIGNEIDAGGRFPIDSELERRLLNELTWVLTSGKAQQAV